METHKNLIIKWQGGQKITEENKIKTTTHAERENAITKNHVN
jgi:hypothetical protein